MSLTVVYLYINVNKNVNISSKDALYSKLQLFFNSFQCNVKKDIYGAFTPKIHGLRDA